MPPQRTSPAGPRCNAAWSACVCLWWCPQRTSPAGPRCNPCRIGYENRLSRSRQSAPEQGFEASGIKLRSLARKSGYQAALRQSSKGLCARIRERGGDLNLSPGRLTSLTCAWDSGRISSRSVQALGDAISEAKPRHLYARLRPLMSSARSGMSISPPRRSMKP
jgi:hypothetical protein